MKRGNWKKLISTALVAGMVLTCAATPALAAEPDSVQEFRQGKTRMVSSVNSGAMVLQEDGSLWAWGLANEGALGNGGNYDKEQQMNGKFFQYRTYPEKVLDDVSFVNSSGIVTLAVKNDGTLWYTGIITKVNTMGMMATSREYQKDFTKLTDNVVYAGSDGWNLYAVKNNGDLWRYKLEQVYDFGEDMVDSKGQAIPGAYHFDLKNEKFLDNVEKISISDDHALALKKDGSVWAWGNTGMGQIGNGEISGTDGSYYVDSEVKIPVKVLDEAKDIFTALEFSSAIKKDGSLWIWGKNPAENIEYDGDKMVSGYEVTPKKILENVKDVATSPNLKSLLKEDGTVWAWGESVFQNDDKKQPRELPLKGYSHIEISHMALFMIKEDGSLWAVGDNQNWTFGMEGIGKNDGGIDIIETPVQLTGLSNATNSNTSTSNTVATAIPTDNKVVLNGQPVTLDAYLIDGHNFLKLRDVAKVLNGTAKQFEVSWDNSKKAINLLSNKPYTAVGGELAKGDGTKKNAELSTFKVYLDGQEIQLTAYTINGSSYYQLRDLGKAIGFYVGWDGSTNTVTIDTSKGYTE